MASSSSQDALTQVSPGALTRLSQTISIVAITTVERDNEKIHVVSLRVEGPNGMFINVMDTEYAEKVGKQLMAAAKQARKQDAAPTTANSNGKRKKKGSD